MQTEQVLRFDPFRLDSSNVRLWRGRQPITLTPKAFAVLCHLAEHAGQLVTKNALLTAIWPETYVSEGVLSECVREVRKALGDTPQAPRFIETVYRRGYRFKGKVVRSQQSGASKKQSKSTPNPQHSTPQVVGRETELRQLHSWLAKAVKGVRQLVFVTGEAGIGKTTVVDAFVTRFNAKSNVWIGRGQCIEHHGQGEAYLPVLEALGRMCREADGNQLIDLLSQHAPTWLVQMPALLTPTDLETLQRRTQGATRERMLRELAEALEVLTTERPLVLWLEDLQWSDVSTLDWLAFVARRREPARLLIIGAYRPVEVIVGNHSLKSVKQELQLHGQCVELPLTFLTEEDVTRYLVRRFASPSLASAGNGQEKGLASATLHKLTQLIHQRTEGNPLFMVNLVDYLVTQGGLARIDGQWRLQGEVTAVESWAPESLQQMIEKQIERLSPQDRCVLEVASVAGAEFSAAAVAAGARIEVEAVEEHCGELARHEQFLQARGTAEWPDGTVAARYGFLHALYQDVLYGQLTARQQQRLHQQIGERVEQAYGEWAREVAAELAVHFEWGRDYRRAVRYHSQATETAIQRYAYQEAASHLSTARELLKTLPDTPERDWQELMLQFTLYIQLGKLKGEATTEAEGAVARVRELSQRVEQTREVFWALAGIYPFYIVREELQTARALAEQALQLAQRFLAPPLLLAAHTELGIVCFFLGQFTVARTHLEKAIAHYAPSSSLPLSFDWDHGPPCLCYTAFVLWHLGYPDQALQQSQKALARLQALRLPYMQAFVLNFAARLHQLRREGNAVQKYAASALRLATEHGFAGMAAVGRVLSGWALAESSKGEEGIIQIRQSLTTFQANGGAAFRAYYLALLAEACSKAGQVEEGLTTVTEALAVVEHTEGRYYEAELYRLKGELLLAQEGKRQKAKEKRYARYRK